MNTSAANNVAESNKELEVASAVVFLGLEADPPSCVEEAESHLKRNLSTIFHTGNHEGARITIQEHYGFFIHTASTHVLQNEVIIQLPYRTIKAVRSLAPIMLCSAQGLGKSRTCRARHSNSLQPQPGLGVPVSVVLKDFELQ